MANFFPEFGSEYNFPGLEASVLKFWKEQKIFQRLLSTKSNRKWYGFYDGPPFATGLPHYGHLLAGTIKDVIPRYWTMRGYHIERRFGWDCHGLPVEYEMEKALNLNGALEIQDYGIAKFNEACRGIVLKYATDWRNTVERMGRWVDLDNDYKTMNPEFMESVWWAFAELWKKGLVYEGKKVVPYSWRITAPLSNFEANQNYRSVQDPAITVLFPLQDNPSTAFLAWTTTPWTLPANLGLAVNPEMEYVRVALKQSLGSVTSAWIALPRLKDFDKELEQEILETQKGAYFKDKQYKELFTYYSDRRSKGAFKVLMGDFVSDSDGTGFVHMAPAFGEDDFYACQKNGIELVDPTDMQACFTKEVPPYQGKFVKDADPEIIKEIKSLNRLLKQSTIQHNYPYCYRSDTPLIYKAISSWFVNVEKIKSQMIKHNQSIHWVPDHIRDGRFGRWLENARDWCISRNRFWGTPIPVWICGDCKHKHVVGSRAELEKLAGKPMPDLHSHFVDLVVTDCPKCGASQKLKRTPEVLDCWFESGSMPYAQMHYPFENEKVFNQGFPADFIAEGLDQTRGWFYTLTVLSTALFDKPAFKNCVVNGMVLAEDGKKMSKRLKNYPDPSHILDKYGADALRLYMMQSPAVHGEELRFSEKFLVENMRAVLLPLWNAYGFFASYANIDQLTPTQLQTAPPPEKREKIDRWILALLKKTELKIHSEMESYQLANIAPELGRFVDNLTNWYIRINRNRFWAGKDELSTENKLAAYATLHEVLVRFSKLIAPNLPYFSEALYAGVKHGKHFNDLSSGTFESVHETIFAQALALSKEEESLINEMTIAQRAILLGRSLRSDAKIGLRQPLRKISLAGLSTEEIRHINSVKEMVLQEINCKDWDILADGSGLVIETLKPNLVRLGKRIGKKIPQITATLKSWNKDQIRDFEKSGKTTIADEVLERDDILIERKAVEGKCAGALEGLVAELDTKLDEELLAEGLMREIINRIQQARKNKKFQLSDRIKVKWEATGICAEILQREAKQPSLISHEVLAKEWNQSSDLTQDWEEFSEHNAKMRFDLEKI